MANKENQTKQEIELAAHELQITREFAVLLEKVALLKVEQELINIELAKLARPDYQLNLQEYFYNKKIQRLRKHNIAWKKLKSRRSSSNAHQRI